MPPHAPFVRSPADVCVLHFDTPFVKTTYLLLNHPYHISAGVLSLGFPRVEASAYNDNQDLQSEGDCA